MPTQKKLLAQLQALEQQVKDLTIAKAVKSTKIKKVQNTTYIPMSMTGEALKTKDHYTELQMLQFRQKNLRKRARELRDTAAWNLQEAEKLEAQANELDNDIENVKLVL